MRLIKPKIILLATIFLYTLMWAAFWQLDLICSPLVWNKLPPDEVFLLPFDIPMRVRDAYCMFYGIMIISSFILLILAMLPYASEMKTAMLKLIRKNKKRNENNTTLKHARWSAGAA